ncbi:MAG: hypothetical protein GF408_07870 [Candidatus Omnitrophica bacterium]|nr:hypothetical protein [Candidatus Omnitrophota bacterium]
MRYQRKTEEKIGEILIRVSALSEQQLKRALDFQKQEGGLLGEILLRLGYVTEVDIVAALTEQYGIPYIPVENYELNMDMAKVVPENVARQFNILPLDMLGDILTLAMSDPLNEQAIEDIKMITGKKVQVFISTQSAVSEAVKKLYRKTDKTEK